MTVAILAKRFGLDPRKAVSMPEVDLFAIAGKAWDRNGEIYVPRIPIDAAEADAMLRLVTIVADATNPNWPTRVYAGYTKEELSEGRPHVLVS